MPTITECAFEIISANHEFDSASNITGVYQNDLDEHEAIPSGFLCVRKSLLPNDGYVTVGPGGVSSAVKNRNSWDMVAAESGNTALDGIYVCNPFDVNMVEDELAENIYKVGANTLGAIIPKGYPTTFTKIKFDGTSIYRFGIGNLTDDLDNYTILTIDDGMLVPGSSAPTGFPYFRVLSTGEFTEGTNAAFGYVEVQACDSGGGGGGGGSVESVNGKRGVVVLTPADIGAAPINSPALTGNPTAPTAPAGDNDTTIATTAFVAEAIRVAIFDALAALY